MSASDDWVSAAERDPLFAVASWEGLAGKWEKSAFYATGESDWRDFVRHWRDYDPGLGGTVLEIGCGAGRITRPLAVYFEHVVAIDVAPAMLALTAAVGPNVFPLLSDSSSRLPVDDSTVDAVFTCHVLQHLDGLAAVRATLVEAFRVLRPGGTAMMHLLHGQPRSLLETLRYEKWLRRARRRNAPNAFRTTRYPVPVIRQAVVDAGFADVELREFVVKSNRDPHAFWLGRRAA